MKQNGPTPRPLVVRFWEKVDKSEGCWLWTGVHDDEGYGVIRTAKPDGGKQQRAHRVSWQLANGPIPDGLWVLHRCDNPPCVRPDHLWLGTHTDNVRDAVSKGRARAPHGMDHPAARLDEMAVLEMRRLFEAGVSGIRLARQFDVDKNTVYHVVRRRTWRHVA